MSQQFSNKVHFLTANTFVMHNTDIALLQDSGNFNTRIRGFQKVIRSSSFARQLISLTCIVIFLKFGSSRKVESAACLSSYLSAHQRVCVSVSVYLYGEFCTWDIEPCRPANASQSFGGKYRLHLQGQCVSLAGNPYERGSKKLCSSRLILLDGVGWLIATLCIPVCWLYGHLVWFLGFLSLWDDSIYTDKRNTTL
jgi:hypothetical protein